MRYRFSAAARRITSSCNAWRRSGLLRRRQLSATHCVVAGALGHLRQLRHVTERPDRRLLAARRRRVFSHLPAERHRRFSAQRGCRQQLGRLFHSQRSVVSTGTRICSAVQSGASSSVHHHSTHRGDTARHDRGGVTDASRRLGHLRRLAPELMARFLDVQHPPVRIQHRFVHHF